MTKKKLAFQPSGSENDADSESDSGGLHNMSKTTKTILHSTMREDFSCSTQLEDMHPNTVPETPSTPDIITRYNSEQTRPTFRSNQPEAQAMSASFANKTQENATHHG